MIKHSIVTLMIVTTDRLSLFTVIHPDCSCNIK